MRNDLIVFEFENLDGREVLLMPSAIGNLGNSLADVFKAALIEFRTEQGAELPARMRNMDIRLAALEPGSIRVGFRAFFGNLTTEDRENLETASAAVTVIDTVVGWMFRVGIAVAVFHQIVPSDDKETEAKIELPKNLSTSEWSDMIEALVSAALGAGADRVVISAPDQPRCILSNNKFRPDLLGSKVVRLEQKLLGDHRGNLKLIGEPVPFNTPEGVKDLALGILDWDYASNPARPQQRTQVSAYVLVEWNSAQPAPPVGPDLIPVEGTLMSLDIADYQALGDLAADHRLVRAVFKVRGMRVYA